MWPVASTVGWDWQPRPTEISAPAAGWAAGAVCAGAGPDPFYADRWSGDNGEEVWAAAAKYCGRCPVIGDCLAAAMVEEDGLLPSARPGVRGGYTPAGRAMLAGDIVRAADGLPPLLDKLIPRPGSPRRMPPAAVPVRRMRVCPECGGQLSRPRSDQPLRCEACFLARRRLLRRKKYHAQKSGGTRRYKSRYTAADVGKSADKICYCVDCAVELVYSRRMPRRCPTCRLDHRRADALRRYYVRKEREKRGNSGGE